MRLLPICFNEHSLPTQINTAQQVAQLSSCAGELYACLQIIHKIRSDFYVEVAHESLHQIWGDKPVRVRLAQLLGRTAYQWLQTKIKPLSGGLETDVEVYYQEKKSEGFTRAYLADTWAISTTVAPEWKHDVISVVIHEIVGEEYKESVGAIPHLSQPPHVERWRREIFTWGETVSDNNVVKILGNFLITMYPLDHDPPHIHLVDPRPRAQGKGNYTVAKYRIDNFSRLEGPPTWDADVKSFVTENNERLLQSWTLCKSGGRPLKLD